MQVINYNGEHSINISNRNTWDYWHLIPSSRPLINPPEPKTEYVDIPGADGSLDYSEVLAGIKFKDRTGTWEFIVAPEYSKWIDTYTSILSFLHGKKHNIVLRDEPMFYYIGRLAVNQWKSDEHNSTITINYTLEPYKIPSKASGGGTINADGTITPGSEDDVEQSDWLWDDLWSNRIYYGRFDIEGTKYRTMFNNTSDNIPVTTTCSSAMRVNINGSNVNLPAGTTQKVFYLKPGENSAIFYGNGRIILDYYIGRML